MGITVGHQTGSSLEARPDKAVRDWGRGPENERQTDEELIGRFVCGDPAAFDSIYGRYYKPVFNFIMKQLDQRDNVEDLTQEVLMRVFKSARTFDVNKKFSSWIFTIAMNEIRRHWRRHSARQTLSLNAPAGDDTASSERSVFLEDQRIAPAELTEHQHVSRNLKSLIDQLPDKQKTVVLLKVYNELKYKEIAEICDSPLSTVLSRMRYALRKLRGWFGNQVYAPGDPALPDINSVETAN